MEQINLDKYSRILLIIFVLLTLLSITATYYKTIVLKDFVIIDDLDEIIDGEE